MIGFAGTNLITDRVARKRITVSIETILFFTAHVIVPPLPKGEQAGGGLGSQKSGARIPNRRRIGITSYLFSSDTILNFSFL